ncbi:DNA-binding protein [Paenibacillus nanensis]|uniref:DNA-binding protein n=1 Tax=Paenibacillus nanensis TaxID=393251 RepID=A0A3A1VRA1_9BACL|nr:helix-turn-helix domain-containing protein [Paenibacillus nanensis]RIX60030.1 DNA-binding protein [Paenibacillus nanensis]
MKKNHDLLTVEEAREILRIGRNAIYNLIKVGLPHIKIGKQIRIPRELLYVWINEQTITS